MKRRLTIKKKYMKVNSHNRNTKCQPPPQKNNNTHTQGNKMKLTNNQENVN